jgi:tetratricopeptide (TPR) repeat protein
MADEANGGAGSRPSLPSALATLDSHPFVGRDVELLAIEDRWRAAVAGRPQLVLLAGEPGIGKTRVARRFAQTAHDGGARVLFGRCDEEPLERYQPFVEAVRGLLADSSASELAVTGDPSLLVRVLPELAARLPASGAMAMDDPETQRYRLFESFASIVRGAAADAPMLLVVDDLQWADQPTLLLLRHLVRQAPPLRLMVLGTFRDTDVGRGHPLGELLADVHRDESLLRRIDVRGLDVPAIEDLLAEMAGHDMDAGGRALARALWRATSGNSFFIRETVTHLVDSDVLVQDDETGRWISHLDIGDMPIPEGVREVVQRRVGRLGEDVQRTLVHAAVIGRTFDVELLAAIVELDEAEVVDHLEAALQAQLVQEVPEVVDRYTFAHALVRETLYATMSLSRRVRLHRTVGEALEARSVDSSTYAALARHFAAASDVEGRAKALVYARQAAEQAMDALAYEGAVGHYRRALSVLDDKGTETESPRGELLLALGRAQHLAGRLDHARETFRRAADLATSTVGPSALFGDAALGFAGVWGDPGNPNPETVAMLTQALTRVDPDDLARRARLLTRLSAELCFSAREHRRAIALGEEAVITAERSGDLRAITDSRWQHRSMLAQPPDRSRREELGRELLERNLVAGSADGVMAAHGWLLLDHLEGGQVEAARADIGAYHDLVERLRMPFRQWYPILWRGTISMLEGRLDEAEACNGEAIAVAGDGADAMLVTNWSAQLFALRLLQGRVGELIPSIETVIEQRPGILAWRAALALACEETGDRARARALYEEVVGPGLVSLPYDMVWGVTCCVLAELACAFGDVERATDLATLLRPFADVEVVGAYGAFCFGPVSLRLGMLARVAGDLTSAADQLEQALAHSTAMGARPWVVAAKLQLALLAEQRGAPGDAPNARQLRAEALAEAEAGGWGFFVLRARTGALPTRTAPVSPW